MMDTSEVRDLAAIVECFQALAEMDLAPAVAKRLCVQLKKVKKHIDARQFEQAHEEIEWFEERYGSQQFPDPYGEFAGLVAELETLAVLDE